MKTLIILVLSFLIMSFAVADEWKAEITRIDKQATIVLVSFDVYQNEQFIYGSAYQCSVENICLDCVQNSIEEYLSQLAFDGNQIIEPADLPDKLNSIKALKGQTIIVDSETLNILKIPSEKQRLKDEVKAVEAQAKWKADAPKRAKKEADRQAGKDKLKSLGLKQDEIAALFE